MSGKSERGLAAGEMALSVFQPSGHVPEESCGNRNVTKSRPSRNSHVEPGEIPKVSTLGSSHK